MGKIAEIINADQKRTFDLIRESDALYLSVNTEVSSSRSTVEVYESRWRKGLDGWDKTDAIYLILEDSSCSKEVTYLRVGWKPRVKDKNA